MLGRFDNLTSRRFTDSVYFHGAGVVSQISRSRTKPVSGL